MNRITKRILLGLLALALLSPLGLLLPRWFHAGDAWGEWSTETVKEHHGYVPKEMAKSADQYHAPIKDYQVGKENGSIWEQSGSYILSGFIGIGVIALLTWGSIKLFSKK